MSKIHPKVQEYLDKVVVRNGQKWIDGDVDLSGLGLTELNFHDIYIKGHFYCEYNQLTTLEGSPKEVGGRFYCSHNQLTNLEGSPKKVGGYFDCSYNRLTNLEGSPKIVNGHFNCRYNKLTTLKGLGGVDGQIYLDKPLKCDYFIQYSLMNKINLL